MIQPVNALSPKVLFRGDYKNSGRPDGSRVERNIAIINSVGVSTAVGASMMAISRSYTSSWKHAGLIGMGAGMISMLFIAPSFLYKAGFLSHDSKHEKDVFMKDKEAHKKLVSNVIETKKTDVSTKIGSYSKNIIKSL